jgi:AraC-like DNA-binding protein
VEWHDFSTRSDLDWSRSFHPDGLEICLNLSGRGEVQMEKQTLALDSSTAGFYAQRDSHLKGVRPGGERHQFMTIEFSPEFLTGQILRGENEGCPHLSRLFSGSRRNRAVLSEPIRLTSEQRQIIMSLRQPPVYAAAQLVWYRAKALEIAATLLYRPSPKDEMFCERQKRLSQERVQKVLAILNENLAEPPPLEEIGRRVGCSHFYLSRIFTAEMGKSIWAHLRDLRMERAASLLREGRMNVTEVALEVGYSSPSHFSQSFCQEMGCCPGLYPLKKAPVESAGAEAKGIRIKKQPTANK